MTRYLGIVGAGAVLLAMLGCSLDSFLAPPSSFSGPKQIVTGSPGPVAAKLEAGLSEAGISVLTKQVGPERRLAGMTKSGKIFCLHLYGQKTGDKERTLVRIKWDREPDEAFWQTVVGILAAPDADASDSEKSADAAGR